MRSPIRSKRAITSGVRLALVAGTTLLVIAALVFTTATAANEAARHGRSAAKAEEVLGANDNALKAVAQAVLLAEDLSFGVADLAAVEAASREAAFRLERLRAASSELASITGASVTADIADRATDNGVEILSLVDEAHLEDAAALLAGDFRDTLEALRDTVVIDRDTAIDAIATTQDFASSAATVTRFVVALLLPLALVVAYRTAARRQLALAEAHLDARLEAEQDVIRAKDEFIAGMSHELRTPLTSIYGFSELLLDMGLVDPDSAMDLIGLINAESAELGRMVEDLLVSARADTGDLVYTTTDVDLAVELNAVLSSQVTNDKTIEVDLGTSAVSADALRVRQVLRNLVSNAVRHGGSSVFVTSRTVDHAVEVTIADDGDGVPRGMMGRLFTRFAHDGSAPLTEGSVGLGLYAARVLAQGMQGDLRYLQGDGVTRFLLTLPASPLEESSSHEAPSHPNRVHSSTDSPQ